MITGFAAFLCCDFCAENENKNIKNLTYRWVPLFRTCLNQNWPLSKVFIFKTTSQSLVYYSACFIWILPESKDFIFFLFGLSGTRLYVFLSGFFAVVREVLGQGDAQRRYAGQVHPDWRRQPRQQVLRQENRLHLWRRGVVRGMYIRRLWLGGEGVPSTVLG